MIDLAASIHDALPQTQCRRCGYDDCAGYAQAIVAGEAAINQCPPGGAEGIARLAQLTGQPVLPLDASFGTEGERTLAVIDEAWCIGCTLCLDACPTDAIVGIHKRMHTVIEAHCTGCELCLPVCPVDCIGLKVATPGRSGWQAWSGAQAGHARARYERRTARLEPKAGESAGPSKAAATCGTSSSSSSSASPPDSFEATSLGGDDTATHEALAPTTVAPPDRKRSIVEAALARARAQRQQR